MNSELVDDIYDRVSSVISEVDREDVEERVEEASQYKLPEDELERTVLNQIANEHGVDSSEFSQASGSGDETVTVSEATQKGDGEWVALRVTFDDEWDTSHENMVQQGLLGDETGRIKFTSWSDANPPELEEGKSYHVKNVVTDEYQGRINVKFTKNTEVDELDEGIEVQSGGEKREVTGALIDFQSGSGLIKRCPEDDCTRVLQSGKCSEHGDVEGEFDMRIKGVLDDGQEAHEVIFNREMTEELTDMSMDEAKDIAMDELDQSAVADRMRDRVIGRYYEVKGGQAGRYLLVDEFEEVDRTPNVDQLLAAVNEGDA